MIKILKNFKFKTVLMLMSALILVTMAPQNAMSQDMAVLLGDDSAINGYVKDERSGETLIGATVILKDTKKGAYTNKLGYYAISPVVAGEYTLRVTSVGYAPYEEKIILTKGISQRKDIMLKGLDIMTEEISVVADRDVESRQISISKVNIPIQQIKEIRIGGESDVFRTIQMLPGVLTSSQMSSGLYIRGGSPDQNLVLLDGSTVYNPSHLFGFISTFNSDAIKDVELIKGGYPAEYGSRLSSVLNITQKDGNRNKFEGLLSAGIISSKLALEGPLGNGSWFISGRRTYFDLIKGMLDTDPENPIPDFGFYDLNAKITQDFGNNDKVFLSGFLSDDNFDFDASGVTMNLFMGNKAGSLRWTRILADNLFMVNNLTSSYYSQGFRQEASGFVVSMNNSITDYSFKTKLEWFVSDNLTAVTGIDVTNYIFKYTRNFSGDDSAIDEGINEGSQMNMIYHDWVYSAFAQINYKITELFSLQTGLRWNFWDYSEHSLFDPRVALRYQITDKYAVKASWGIFHQYLRLAGDENFSIFDTWIPTDKTVDPSKAYHYILSFETEPIPDYNLNVDFYYKDLENISEVNKTTIEGTDVKDIFFSGLGYSYGGEIFLQKQFGKLAGWVGYGLGWVFAKFDSINNGEEFRPKYDRRHDLKIVAQYQINDKWNVGATFMYQSGQSYTGATSRFQTGMPGDNYGWGKVIPSQRYGLRMPNSHQLNLNASYLTTLFKLPFKINLDIFNVYNRRDILMRIYDTEGDETIVEDIKLLPIIPTMSFELKF